MNNIKSKFRVAFLVALFLVITNLQKANAQGEFFSISELRFDTMLDSTADESNKLVVLKMRVSDVSLASEIHVEMGEEKNDYTLHTANGIFINENGSKFIESEGTKQLVFGRYLNFYFKVSDDIIEKWKFTRVHIDLYNGEKSKNLYHRR